MDEKQRSEPNSPKPAIKLVYEQAPRPLPNYTLSTVCPACDHETFKLACKVRCPRCGFVWDCSEL